MNIKARLIFNDWQNAEFESVYATEQGIELSCGQFHSGSTWPAEIIMDDSEAKELREAITKGFRPVFELYL